MRAFSLDKPELIDTCWADFAVLLQRFEMICQDLTADQIVLAVKQSRMQFFGLQDDIRVHGFVVTEIHNTAKGPVCVLVGACGEAPEPDKRELLTRIEEWARERGCVAMRIIGRKGWLRWDRRFHEVAKVMEAPL